MINQKSVYIYVCVCVCVCITKSLCHTAEIDTVLEINFVKVLVVSNSLRPHEL